MDIDTPSTPDQFFARNPEYHGVEMQVARTILAQLGGRRFQIMTGAKNFGGSHNSLKFTLPRNKVMKIILTPADTYTLELYKINLRSRTADGICVKIDSMDNIYCDQLQDVFTTMTGLFTSLGTMGVTR